MYMEWKVHIKIEENWFYDLWRESQKVNFEDQWNKAHKSALQSLKEIKF